MSQSNIQRSPGSIFICYRRDDAADVTGRIYDRLVDHFGPERVFMDVEAIRYGYDFRSEIDETIKVCSIVIVVIGDEWLAETDGKRRIDDENDYVRIEIESALRREIPIIPVLTRGASHPTKAMLPASLEALAYRQGTSIRHDHFRRDMDSLIIQIDKLLPRHGRSLDQLFLWLPESISRATSAAISAIAAFFSKLRVPLKQRLIIVTVVGATVILAITGLLKRCNTPPENDYVEAVKLATGLRGTRIDLPKAAKYLQRAAAKKVPEAEARLAYWVNNGVGGLAKDNVALLKSFRHKVEVQNEVAGAYRCCRPGRGEALVCVAWRANGLVLWLRVCV